MASAALTLISRAELTSINEPEYGRRALVIDGMTIELGDTGLRDLTGLLQNVKSGKLYFRRIGYEAQFWADNIVKEVAGNTSIVPGTASLATAATSVTTWEAVGGTGLARLGISSAGNVVLNGEPGTYSGGLKVLTAAAWWNSARPLPGVAYGQPVGV